MGDLNLTLSSGEIWGGVRNLDCLGGFSKNFFLGLGLIDILPGKIVLNWWNNRASTELIAKRLHRDFIFEDLLASVDIFRYWVEYPYISYHAPILLQLDILTTHLSFHFKMNPFWIQDLSFEILVKQVWNDPKYLGETGKQHRLIWNLKDLKL